MFLPLLPLLMSGIIAFAEGLVTYAAWNYFIVPFGVVSVSLPQMVGIQLAIRFFKPREFGTKDPFTQVGEICGSSCEILGLIFSLGHLM